MNHKYSEAIGGLEIVLSVRTRLRPGKPRSSLLDYASDKRNRVILPESRGWSRAETEARESRLKNRAAARRRSP
jgi:hypothetical protein